MNIKSVFRLLTALVVLFVPLRANAQADRGAIRGEAQDTQKGASQGRSFFKKYGHRSSRNLNVRCRR